LGNKNQGIRLCQKGLEKSWIHQEEQAAERRRLAKEAEKEAGI